MSNKLTVEESCDGLAIRMNGESTIVVDYDPHGCRSNGQRLTEWLESVGFEAELEEIY